MNKDYSERERRYLVSSASAKKGDAEPEKGLIPIDRERRVFVSRRALESGSIEVRDGLPNPAHDWLYGDDPLDLGEPLSTEVLVAAANAVTAETDEDPKHFVLEFVEERREISPEWDPGKSYMGDGERSFAYYWNTKPRNYEALARIIRHHIARTR